MASSNNELAFNYSPQGIPIFVGESYDLWSILMKTLFIFQDLQDAVGGWGSVCRSLQIVSAVFHMIVSMKPNALASFISFSLCSFLLYVSFIFHLILLMEFDNLALKDNEDVQEFCSRTSTIINQIRDYEETINDKKVMEKVLRSVSVKSELYMSTSYQLELQIWKVGLCPYSF